MKTLILTCTRRSAFVSGYVDGLLTCAASPHFAGWMHADHESDIARGRSNLLTQALRTKFDSFLWIDDDIAFTQAQFDAICTIPADCVGGVYPKRQPDLAEVWTGLLGEELPGHPDVVTVRTIGTGFLRHTRRAAEALRGRVPEITTLDYTHYFHARVMPIDAEGLPDPDSGRDGHYLTEDYAFCHDLWEAGIPVYLHRGIKLGHVGDHTFRPR